MTIRTPIRAAYAATTPFAGFGLSQMMRGPTVFRAPEDDNGHVPGDDQANDAADKAKAAEAAAKEKAEAAEREAKEKAEKEKGNDKPSDAEAKLLKDVMKQKEAARAAQAEAAAARAALQAFDGIDVEEVKKLLKAKEDAERAELEKKGEYERILAKVNEEADKRVAEVTAKAEEAAKALAAAQARIDALTVGHGFGNSKFLSEKTVLTPDKARRLYGDHFDIVDGATVAYDKPRGETNRTPLVDARGEHLDFEAAIEKIVTSDPDFDRLARSKMKTGSGSGPSNGDRPEEKKSALTGRELIAANLAALAKPQVK